MSHTPASTFQKEPDHETIPSSSVLALDQSATAEDDKATAQKINLTAKEKQAIKVLGEVLNRRSEEAKKSLQRRLEDENFVIQKAAQQLTGLALTSSPSDQRFLIAHHLKEFFAALSLPPGLDAPSREALRLEALTMLLKFGPQDDFERMLLIQLIASHMASMTCFSRAAAPEASPELAAQALGQAQKMSRLFLDLERSFRQRRKQLGQPKRDDATNDPKDLARRVLFFLAGKGIFLDDEDASA